MVSIPAYLLDPFKLDALAVLLGANPESLRAAIERDYAAADASQSPVYASNGTRKAGFLMRTLEQCQQLASTMEWNANSPTTRLSQGLQHVQVQLAAVVGYYEEQLRRATAPPLPAGPEAAEDTPYGGLLRWRDLLAIAPTLAPHLLDEPVLASITDHYGEVNAYPLKLERNPAEAGERGIFIFEGNEEYQILPVVDQERGEEGLHLLRTLPAGLPMLAFSFTDEDAEERNQKLRTEAQQERPQELAAPVPGLPLFPAEPSTGPNYLP